MMYKEKRWGRQRKQHLMKYGRNKTPAALYESVATLGNVKANVHTIQNVTSAALDSRIVQTLNLKTLSGLRYSSTECCS